MFDFVNTLLKEEDMKKLNALLLVMIFAVMFLTGCGSNKINKTSMLRTTGVCESALPIEQGSFAIETFLGTAASVDIYSSVSSKELSALRREQFPSRSKSKGSAKVFGFNGRYGINNSTEVKIGFLASVPELDLIMSNSNDRSTNFTGFEIGVKRLLTDYSNPVRLSLYLEGKRLNSSTKNELGDKYDGKSAEFKSAIICGYLEDPTHRTFPSVSLYYSLANASRNESIPNLPYKKQPQAIGIEANFNIDLAHLYANISAGLEKEFADKATNSFIPYAEIKLGLNLLRNKWSLLFS